MKIFSRMAKAAYLLDNSEEMPRIVSACCAFWNIPYTRAVLEFVAASDVMVDFVNPAEGEAVDEFLRRCYADQDLAIELDSSLSKAVEAYKKAQETGGSNG